jgi:hypothetical protein
MADRDPDGPSAPTTASQGLGGLSSLHPGITASSDLHVHPSEAAHVSAAHSALRKDFGSFNNQRVPPTTTFEFDEFPALDGLDEPGFLFWTEDSWSLPDTGLEQICVVDSGLQSEQACDPAALEASPFEPLQFATELRGAKRTVPSSPLSGFVHKVCEPSSHAHKYH